MHMPARSQFVVYALFEDWLQIRGSNGSTFQACPIDLCESSHFVGGRPAIDRAHRVGIRNEVWCNRCMRSYH